MQCTKLLISGRVQDVGFRQTAKQIATSLQIKGSVRNLSTGDVELIVVGSHKLAETLLRAIQDTLSEGAISSYTMEEITLSSPFSAFRIER